MKGMNQNLLLLVALAVLLPGSVLGQSLAEVAQKEKKRRAETKEPVRVISERELQTGRRSTSLPSASAPAAASEAEGDAAGDEAIAEEPEVDETTTREYWQNRVTATKEKIAALEEQLQSPESDWGGGMRTDVNPIGQRNLSQRQDVESQLAAARAELAQIQNEARRAGVPAGWVR